MSQAEASTSEEESAEDQAAAESKAPEDLTTVIRAEVLQTVVDQLLSVADEAILHIGREGLEVAVVDPANIATVFTEVDPGAFETVGDGMFPIGLNLQRLNDYIDGASGSDPVTLAYIPETRMLNIRHTNVDVEMAAIDPETIRKEPDVPEFDVSAEFTADSKEFVDALTNAELASDHVALEADVEARELVVLGEGDTDDVRTRFDEEKLLDFNFKESVEALYSLDYFLDITRPVPGGTELTCKYGDEFPVKMTYEFADGYGEMTIMLAPRIEAR